VPQYAQSKFTQQTSPQFSFGKSQFIAATAACHSALIIIHSCSLGRAIAPCGSISVGFASAILQALHL
jgi:hypothetical protein